MRKILLFFFLCISVSFGAEQLIVEPDMGRAPILSLMNDAQFSIKLVIYGLTDNQFIDALIRAKDKNRNVQILLEPNPYRAEDENTFAFQQLHAHHIDLQSPNPDFKLTHQKTLLIDQHYAIIMTFNFTHSTFKKERNFALIITDPAELQEIQQVFSADQQHIAVSVQNPHLVWSPNNSRAKILKLIHSAHSSIKIYAEGLSDYQIIGALAQAARSGVNVQVLMSPEAQLSRKKVTYLNKAGVTFRFSKNYMIHAKVIIIDQQQAMLGSINLTKYSLDSNRELAVITESPNTVAQLNTLFNQDWREANFAKKHIEKEMVRFLRHVHKYF